MKKNHVVWSVVAALFGLACMRSHMTDLTRFSTATISSYTGDGDILTNLQFFLDGELELEGHLESMDVQVGEYHQLIVTKFAIIDHVTFRDRLPGRIIDVQPRWARQFPTIKKFAAHLGFKVTYTLWMCFEEDATKILPFRPGPGGYYYLSETSPGNGKVKYGKKEYSIVGDGTLSGLWYKLDYNESSKNQDRMLPGSTLE